MSPTVYLYPATRQPGGVAVYGTATDPDAFQPVQVVITIGGVSVATLTADTNGHFSGTVPARDGTTVCAKALNQNDGVDKTVCQSFTVRLNPFGYLDEVSPGPPGLHVRGWAIDPDTANPIPVWVYVDGVYTAGTTASADRPDVGAAYPGYGNAHGYDLTVPASPGQHSVCTYGVNVGAGTSNSTLGCKTVTQGGPPAAPDVFIFPSQTSPLMTVAVSGSADVTLYTIEKSLGDQSGPWVLADHELGPGMVSWNDTHVVQGTNYCYRASADNAYGRSAPTVRCRARRGNTRSPTFVSTPRSLARAPARFSHVARRRSPPASAARPTSSSSARTAS